MRNLSYMISRREKMKKQFNSARESVFYAALDVLTDKKLNLSNREVEKIVKTYKDLPPPYGTSVKIKTPPGSKPGSISSRTSSVDKDLETPVSEQLKVEKRRVSTDNFSDKKKVETVKEITDIKKVETIKEKDSSDNETPKPRRGRPKSKQLIKLEVEDVTDSVEDTEVSAMDTSEMGTEDDTLVNVTQEDSFLTEEKTLMQSDLELDKKSQGKGKVEGKRSVGRPRKIKTESDSVKESDKDSKDRSVKDINRDSKDKDTEVKKPAAKKTRTRSSLPEIIDLEEETEKKDIKVEIEEEPMEIDIKPAEREFRTRTTSERRERRHSAAMKLSDKEKEELVAKYPSAKNVSDHIKSELTSYFNNNKLLVSSKLRQKVQTALLNGKRRNRLGNGIIIDHSQRKIDAFFVKSPPQCNPESHKSPAKNVSRVLNELSPTRDRLEANNIERTTILRSGVKVSDCQISHRNGNTPHRHSPALSDKSYDGRSVGSPGGRPKRGDSAAAVRERLFDDDNHRVTRSRESTPESTASSVKSVGSNKHNKMENTRTRTRSMTPVCNGKDSDESESENIYETRRLRR